MSNDWQDRLEKEAFKKYSELVSTMPKGLRTVLNYLTKQEDFFAAVDALGELMRMFEEAKGKPVSEEVGHKLLCGISYYLEMYFDRWFWDKFQALPKDAQERGTRAMREMEKEFAKPFPNVDAAIKRIREREAQ